MTNTDLANIALGFAGMPTIDSIDAELESARSAKIFIDVARKAMITDVKLNKAQKEVALALASGETSSLYDYVYLAPSDMLCPICIWDGDDNSTKIEYAINTHSSLNTDVIKTDQEDAVLFYCTDLPNLNRYSAVEQITIAYLLAAFLAAHVKVDHALARELEEKYFKSLSLVKADNNNFQGNNNIKLTNFSRIKNMRA